MTENLNFTDLLDYVATCCGDPEMRESSAGARSKHARSLSW